MSAESIGRNVKSLREALRLTQDEVVQQLKPDASIDTYRKLEQGKIDNPRYLQKLARILGVDESEIRKDLPPRLASFLNSNRVTEVERAHLLNLTAKRGDDSAAYDRELAELRGETAAPKVRRLPTALTAFIAEHEADGGRLTSDEIDVLTAEAARTGKVDYAKRLADIRAQARGKAQTIDLDVEVPSNLAPMPRRR